MTGRYSPTFLLRDTSFVLSFLHGPYGGVAGASVGGRHPHPSISPPTWRKQWQLIWGEGSWPSRIIPWATSSSWDTRDHPELLMVALVWALRIPWTSAEPRNLYFTEECSCPDNCLRWKKKKKHVSSSECL